MTKIGQEQNRQVGPTGDWLSFSMSNERHQNEQAVLDRRLVYYSRKTNKLHFKL